ncbi:hypothetical protein DZG02_14715, partial [Clavibacter lycopersici]
GIGGREDPVRLVFDTDPGPAVVVASCRPAASSCTASCSPDPS